MHLSEGKLKHMKALSNEHGVIAAAAMDQRGSLQKSLGRRPRRGCQRDHARDDERVQGGREQGADAACQRHPARSRIRPGRRQSALHERRPAAGLRTERLRQHPARPPARSAAARFREAHCGLGRGRGQDSDLLLALRRCRRSTTSSTPSSSASARNARPTRSRSSWSSSATIPRAATKRAWSSPKPSRRSS